MLRVFEDVNASDQYLRGIAETDPKLFLSLVARLIPVASEVMLDQRVTVNIGSAMIDAQARLESFGKAVSPVIDHAPLVLAGEPVLPPKTGPLFLEGEGQRTWPFRD